MQSQEVRALGELASEAFGGATARIQEMHEGIAERVFDSVGVTASPVRLIHDGIANGVYAGLRTAFGSAFRAGARAISLTRPPQAPSIERATTGRVALGALNGAFGDRLERQRSPLAVHMTVRRGGAAVDLDADAVRAAFPDATGRLAVFLHGLCETEEAWTFWSPGQVPYGPRLRVDLGYTPVYIRYNSGRHISDNGRELAQLLDQLTAVWPVPREEIALFGHSMGGLIARSACHQGAGHPWVTHVRHVFMLSCPHLGAPLERATHAASAALALLPETRSMATALNARSCGIKDLRYGYLLEEDWSGHDPDQFGRRMATEIPFLRSANHYFVSASISRNPDGIAGRLVGDLLVVGSSAWAQAGHGKRLAFPIDHYSHVGGIHHFKVLNHPAVYEQIRKWLTARPALNPPPLELTAGSE
jgi:pimeloyl-ACP methyl ester carboxylesterase